MPDRIAPTQIARAVLDWYRAHARDLPWRRQPGAAYPTDPAWPYRVWLSEIMLQQTTVPAVMAYFARFTSLWPDVFALAAARDEDVMREWAGLGYYARARNLLACARAVVQEHGGVFPRDEAALRDLPGIGDYTAAAIAAFAFGRDAVVIDGNIERVTTRLFGIATPLPAARPAIRAALATELPSGEAADFAQGMMDLARAVCTPRSPRCMACPLMAHCAAFRSGDPEVFPVKAAKRPRPTRHGTAWWIEAEGAVLTVIRPPKGLLGGMRALPSSDWVTDAAPPPPPLPGDWRPLGRVTHGFTHFELLLDVQACRLSARPDLAGSWLARADVSTSGMPTVFAKAVTLAMEIA